jgi:hypothetical protein
LLFCPRLNAVECDELTAREGLLLERVGKHEAWAVVVGPREDLLLERGDVSLLARKLWQREQPSASQRRTLSVLGRSREMDRVCSPEMTRPARREAPRS